MNKYAQASIDQAVVNVPTTRRLARSQNLIKEANIGAQRYFELMQKSFDRVADSYPDAGLGRRLAEAYSTSAQEYSEKLQGLAKNGERLTADFRESADRVKANGKTVGSAITKVSEDRISHRTR